jgi:hypothetical protein
MADGVLTWEGISVTDKRQECLALCDYLLLSMLEIQFSNLFVSVINM